MHGIDVKVPLARWQRDVHNLDRSAAPEWCVQTKRKFSVRTFSCVFEHNLGKKENRQHYYAGTHGTAARINRNVPGWGCEE